jgi:hypothetical protein
MALIDWTGELVEMLASRGVNFAPGLSLSQLTAAENRVGCRFPPDLRWFLQIALPIGDDWPDWRDPDSPFIADRLDWPARGMAFDIEHNAFWWPAWGSRPVDLDEAIAVARAHLQTVPRLIPIVSHRYLPAEPEEAGNPVLSVYQTDIIYYGRDLRDYFMNEFFADRDQPGRSDEPKKIRFWSDLIG